MASPIFDDLSVKLSRIMEDPVAAATTDGDSYTSTLRSQILNESIRRCLSKWTATRNEDALREYIATESQALSSSVKALSGWTGGVHAILSARNVTDGQIVLPVSNALVAEVVAGNNKYLRGASTAGTVVSGVTFTATGTAITSFAGSGVLSSHVGGSFVGLDNGGTPFSRLITAYVSTSAFTIDAALGTDGAGTNGYIIPVSTSTNQKYYLNAGNFTLVGGTATSSISLTYVKQHTDLSANGSNDLTVPSQHREEILNEAAAVFYEQYPSQENTVKLGMLRGKA